MSILVTRRGGGGGGNSDGGGGGKVDHENAPSELSFQGIRNTSVSSIFLPSDGFNFASTERPSNSADAKPESFACKVEMINDTSHLGSGAAIVWGRSKL